VQPSKLSFAQPHDSLAPRCHKSLLRLQFKLKFQPVPTPRDLVCELVPHQVTDNVLSHDSCAQLLVHYRVHAFQQALLLHHSGGASRRHLLLSDCVDLHAQDLVAYGSHGLITRIRLRLLPDVPDKALGELACNLVHPALACRQHRRRHCLFLLHTPYQPTTSL
jgi:hypothetical protein